MRSRNPFAAVAVLVASLGVCMLGCGEDPAQTVVFVTVDARPAVLPTATLEVELTHDNVTLAESFEVDEQEFPLTFTITPEGRTGELTIDLEAVDRDGRVVARGATTATIVPDERSDAEIMLEAEDFVVNASVAGDQRLTFVSTATGRQIASFGDGSFVIGFVNDCAMLGRCDVFGRLYDDRARPAVNDTSQDAGELIVNLTDEFTSVPALARGDAGVFVVWESTTDIRGTLLDTRAGHVGFTDTIISTGADPPSAPAVAPLAAGGFAVVWREFGVMGTTIKARLLGDDGQPAVNPLTGDTGVFDISTDPVGNAAGPAIAGTGEGLGFVVVWQDGASIFGRFVGDDGLPRPSSQVALVTRSAGSVWGPRVAFEGTSAVVVWGAQEAGDPVFADGAFVAGRFAPPTGTPVGARVILSDTTPDTISPAGIATGAAGRLAFTWHACGDAGDGAGCGVWLQLARPSGLGVGVPVAVNTTRPSDQTGPAVAATAAEGFAVTWTDTSEASPDGDGSAVRARVVYPAYEARDGRRGAHCGSADDAPCGDGLVCAAGSEGTPYCHDACEPGGPAPQCPRGGLCTADGDTGACLF